MSVTKQITIGCENCAKWEQLGGSSVKTARKELKEQGWTSKRVKGGVLDYCPQCSAITDKYKRRKPPRQKKKKPSKDKLEKHVDIENTPALTLLPPGSIKAWAKGCCCPRMDNEYGRGLGGCGEKFGWVINGNCPVHGAKK